MPMGSIMVSMLVNLTIPCMKGYAEDNIPYGGVFSCGNELKIKKKRLLNVAFNFF